MDFKAKIATVTMKDAKSTLERKAVEKGLPAPFKVSSFAEAGAGKKYALAISGMT